MPIEYSDTVKLRLSNNIIFYEKQAVGSFSLFDKFAISGGPAIVLELGWWDMDNGIELEGKINRWDRRTDLSGAKLVNTLEVNGALAQFIYDTHGRIIGSNGWLQDQLFYMTDRLNVTIETRETPKGKTCASLLDQQKTDICTGGASISVVTRCRSQEPGEENKGSVCTGNEAVSLNMWEIVGVVTLPPFDYTLLARVPTENELDSWAFVNVFGYMQWMLILCALMTMSLLTPLFQIVLHRNQEGPPISEAIIMPYLFLIQQGDHPDSRNLTPRVLSLTLSMATFMVFTYYANQLTAEMTAGAPPPHPIRTFQDVLDLGIKVIVAGGTSVSLGLLEKSNNGSAKRSVYDLYLADDHKRIVEYLMLNHEGKSEEASQIKLPAWATNFAQANAWAEEQIMQDKNTMWFCSRECALQKIKEGRIQSLEMDDSSQVYAGVSLRSNSEFLPVFKHHILKATETGVLHRLELNYIAKAPIEIGMKEPGPLGARNVMFPFSLLCVFVIISLGIAIVEKVVNMK